LNKLSITDPRLVEAEIIKFILKMKKEGKHDTAIENYVKPVILYYKINDVLLNTKKINRFIPEKRKGEQGNKCRYSGCRKHGVYDKLYCCRCSR
jgi:hypothetical protein